MDVFPLPKLGSLHTRGPYKIYLQLAAFRRYIYFPCHRFCFFLTTLYPADVLADVPVSLMQWGSQINRIVK